MSRSDNIHSTIMNNNNNYFSSSFDDYLPSYDYSFEYSSPSSSTYIYSSLLPPPTPSCPFHSPHIFYTSILPAVNISPVSYTYQQQPLSQVYSPPPVQQYITDVSDADRTPLRRHQCFKKNELEILHQAYIHDSHPSFDILQQLAVRIKAPVDKVRQWFKNRRHSDKRKKREVSMGRTSKTN